MKYFEQRPFSVGDKVWNPTYGYGVVTAQVNTCGACIDVEFYNHNEQFYKDGKRVSWDIAPSLYHCGDTIIIPNAPEQQLPERRKLVRKDAKEFRPFDKVLVRDDIEQIWRPVFWGRITDDIQYPYECISDYPFADCIQYEGNEWALWQVTDAEDMEVL